MKKTKQIKSQTTILTIFFTAIAAVLQSNAWRKAQENYTTLNTC